MIDFELSEEQQMIRDSVGAFAREEIRPSARPADETGTIPTALVPKAWQLGLVSGPVPEKFGGGGETRSGGTAAILPEELGFDRMALPCHLISPRRLPSPLRSCGARH